MLFISASTGVSRPAVVACLCAAALTGAQSVGGSFEEHLQRGIQLAQAGDLDRAAGEARKSVELAPAHAASLAFLGLVLTRQEKLEEAVVYLSRAVAADPRQTGARFNLGLNYFRLGRLKEAEAALQRVIEDQPGHEAAVLLLGTAASKRGDCTRALPLLESVPNLVLRQPESTTALARCYYASGRIEDGRKILRAFVNSAAPSDASSAVATAIEARDFDGARELVEGIPGAAKVPQLGYFSAYAQYNAGAFEAAARTLEQLISTGAQQPDIYELLGWCYHRRQKAAEASDAMQQAVQIDSESGARRIHLAQMLLEQNRYDAAHKAALDAVRLARSDPRAYKILGDIEAAQGLFKQAEAAYAKAALLDENDAEAVLLLADTRHRLWKYSEAAATLEAGLKKHPHNARMYLAYGKVLLDPGARSDSRAEQRGAELLNKAIANDTSLAEAHYELGKYLLRSGNAADSIPHLEVAAKLMPDSSVVHLSLANAYRRTGNSQAAAEHMSVFTTLTKETGP